MGRLTKNDLAQMNEAYFESLDNERLVKVASNLLNLGINLIERLEQNYSNSSKPPSSDNPFDKATNKDTSKEKPSKKEEGNTKSVSEEEKIELPQVKEESKGTPGRQVGSKGFGRTLILECDEIVPHYPSNCNACDVELSQTRASVYTGYYTYELEIRELEIRVVCNLHHYYAIVCDCGHETRAVPGTGYVSYVEGRKKELKLTEAVMVGPLLTTFISALSVRYRMSRVKIK
ncbi:MAG: DUF6444 domain-containing protein, partial [Candidatus Magnetoovum sp. WYHC-5]|nr:DUF6444 domain-containing protein [Candidatus Magnetoovum sp. WYHC-5]